MRGGFAPAGGHSPPAAPPTGDAGDDGVFSSPEHVQRLLLERGYLADPAICDAVFLAERLGKPVLVEGPAGVGKTALATATAAATGRRVIRLQCYEGLDEAKALYEWDYRKQLLRLQAGSRPDEGVDWQAVSADLYSEEFLLPRPLLAAIASPEPTVLLVDEVDRVEAETEALLLEVLSEFQVSLPELGTIRARTQPLVFLTSNGTRELSEALKRRCLFLPATYPDPDREAAILRLRVPEASEELGAAVTRIVAAVRRFELRKPPSISETIDWARALTVLGVGRVDQAAIDRTLTLLVKHADDVERVRRELDLDTVR